MAPENLDRPISVVAARGGDGIARLQGEEDGKKTEKKSRGRVQGKDSASGDQGRQDALRARRAVRRAPASDKQLLERAGELFGGPSRKDEPAVDVKAMQAKIGQLALENDFLEGALIKAGMLSAKR